MGPILTECVVVTVGADSKLTHTADVEPGYTCEICLAQSHSSLGDGSILSIAVEFFGLETGASPTEAGPSMSTVPRLTLSAVQPVQAVHVRAAIRQAMLAPSASLSTVEQAFAASSYSISPLDPERDMWPAGNRLFKQLVMSYDVEITTAGRYTMMSPVLAGVIYESEYDSQLLLVYDSRDQFVGAGYHRRNPMPLAKGKYTALLQVRHEDDAALEDLVAMSPPLVVSRDLSRSVSVSVTNAFQAGSSARRLLKVGDTTTAYLTAPALSVADRASLQISPGDVLSGSVRFEAPGATVSFTTHLPWLVIPATCSDRLRRGLQAVIILYIQN